MKNLIKPFILTVTIISVIISCTKKDTKIVTGGPEVVSFKVLPFELSEVKLLDGPFKHATGLNIQSLLNYKRDRLLAKSCPRVF